MRDIQKTRLEHVGILGALTVVLIIGVSTVARAQTDEVRTWMRVDTVHVKPEMWQQFHEIQREEVNPALQRAGVPWRSAWRTGEFGDGYAVMLVTPIEDFAAYDQGDLLSGALSLRELERLREKIRRCITGRESHAIHDRRDLSVGSSRRPFAVISTLSVAPGRGQEFESFLRDTLPTFAEADVVFGIYQRVFGGPSAWLLVQNLDSLAELDRPGVLVRAFGEEGADRVSARLAGVVTSVERTVLRYDLELSYSLPASASPQ